MRGLLGPTGLLLGLLALTAVLWGTNAKLHAQTLRITSPADGAVVKPGETISVTVSVTGGTVPDVVLAVENPIGYSEGRMAPPYTFLVPIPPSTSLGRYSVIAAVLGRQGDEGIHDRVFVDVERPDAPVKLELNLHFLSLEVGDTGYLRAQATYTDGVEEEVTKSTRTKWSSDAPEVAAVADDGRVSVRAPGFAKITVENGGRTAVVRAAVTAPRPIDRKP